MAQAFYPTNDGRVGNLQNLTDIELNDLIHRQETLLKKKSFISHLPDKGAKIGDHYAKLKDELTRRQTSKSESTHDNKMGLNKIHSDTVSSDVLVERLQGMNLLSDSNGAEASNQINHQYDIAVSRALQNKNAGKKEPMKLNRQLNIEKVCDLPEDIKKMKENLPAVKHREKSNIPVQEESAVVPPTYKYSNAKQIDLTESLELQRCQKQKQEELQAQLAAEKLAQRLNIKMEDYNPEGVDMSYRSKVNDDLDSDDDDDGGNDGPIAYNRNDRDDNENDQS